MIITLIHSQKNMIITHHYHRHHHYHHFHCQSIQLFLSLRVGYAKIWVDIYIFAKDLFMFLKSSTALFVCLFVCCVCLFVVFTHFHSTGEENRYIFVAHHHDLKSSCCLFQEKFQNYKSNKIQALKVGVQYVVTKARKRSHCPNTRKQNISKVQIRKTKQCWHWRLWKRKIGLVRCGNQSKSRESLSYHKKTKH